MAALPMRLVRGALRSAKSLVRSSRLGRDLLSDLNNSDEFGSLLAHERMLADRVRVDTYHAAINRHVQPGDRVIDLGTGTGILALFAAARRPARVYALDHSPFIEVARRIAAHNGIDCIDFVASNSRDFRPPEAVDLIIHEQLGDELFSENMLHNLLDLKARALKPGGRILPARFELFVEPAQLRPERRLPFIWERPVHGIDFGILRGDPVAAAHRPADYGCYVMEPGAVEQWLCAPQPLLAFDLDRMQAPDELPRSVEVRRTVLHDGLLDGFAVYFRAVFDATLAFDTSPLGPLTHWRSRLFRMPQQRRARGEVLALRLELDDPADIRSWSLTVDGIALAAGRGPIAASASGG